MNLKALIQKSGIKRIIPDKLYLAVKYRSHFGHWMSFKHPKTFNEKLQWLKLYNRKPEYTIMVDKYAVKQYVSDIIGKEYIIPTLGVWNSGEDIDWDNLPDSFVLKCTHDSGGLIICKDKSQLDKTKAIKKLDNSLRHDFYLLGREWPYKDVPRRIIAEQYMEDDPNVNDLSDYKWWCFNGVPKFCQVIQNRSTKETIDFFDTEWNHQEFIGLNPKAVHADVLPLKPKNIEKHIQIAQELSKNIPFVRIDLYEIKGHTYFGEITFYPTAGTGRFTPSNYDEIIGAMIVLPE